MIESIVAVLVCSFKAESVQGMDQGLMGLKSEFNRPTIADELCAVVECLLTARYSEAEIVDYLEGPFGASPEAAARAVSLVASSTPSTGVRAER